MKNNVKILRSIFLLFFFLSTIKAQKPIDHWESAILPTNPLKYFIGNAAPDPNWKAVSFEDSTWQDGKCAIGYGDDDDSTVVGQVISVYTRTTFQIDDTSKISYAVLHIDFDDSFVAYLNGVEIARSNIGTIGMEPAYNDLAFANHEAKMYTGGSPEEFSIPNSTLTSAIKPGENILSIQIHNVVDNSSDMSGIFFLSFAIGTSEQIFSPTPHWFMEPVVQQEEFTSSNLPILIINTEGGVDIPDEPKVNAMMGIIHNDDTARNFLNGPWHKNSGPIAIERRGNASQGFDKKPYGFETRDSLGFNRNDKLLGMPGENDWILRACYIDKTLMRNTIAMRMSRKMGNYASRNRFCEVVLNGEYQGVYLAMEKIKWDPNRLNIDKLTQWMNDQDTITGGYIYEVSQSGVEFGERRRYRYPAPDLITTRQANYLRNYDDKFRSVMESNTYNDPYIGFPKYIDVNSFIDELIIQEATKNSDAYGWSSYFHKDRLKKLCAGPAWDFDQSLCNSTFNEGDKTDEWIFSKGYSSVPTFWEDLFEEPTFKYLMKKRWFELREDVLNTDNLMAFIDSTAAYLDEAQERNFARWPILGKFTWRDIDGYEQRDTYQKEVDFMKEWFEDHLAWIDSQMERVPDQTIEIPNLVISEIMYAPIDGPENEFIEITNNSNSEVNLTGIFFSNGITFTFPEGAKLPAGENAVIASNAEKFKLKYGFEPIGQFYGQLDNAGEKVAMQNSWGVEIDAVRFNDKAPWPEINLINPGSIQLTDLNKDNSLSTNWSRSDKAYGDPYNASAIDGMISSSSIQIYPNPAKQYININLSMLYNGNVEITLIDALGRNVLEQNTNSMNNHTFTIDIHDLNTGYYVVRIATDSQVITKQVLIAK